MYSESATNALLAHTHQFIGLKNKETYKVRKAVKKLEDLKIERACSKGFFMVN